MKSTSLKSARLRIAKAHWSLVHADPFLCFLLLEMPYVVVSKDDPATAPRAASVPTAATDYRRLYYNADFVGQLSDKSLVFVAAHEVCHVLFKHLSRAEGRNPTLWHAACDYVINWKLKASICQQLKGTLAEFPTIGGKPIGLIDPAYAKLTSEQAYELLKKNLPPIGAESSIVHPDSKANQQSSSDGVDNQSSATEHERGAADQGAIPKNGPEAGSRPRGTANPQSPGRRESGRQAGQKEDGPSHKRDADEPTASQEGPSQHLPEACSDHPATQSAGDASPANSHGPAPVRKQSHLEPSVGDCPSQDRLQASGSDSNVNLQSCPPTHAASGQTEGKGTGAKTSESCEAGDSPSGQPAWEVAGAQPENRAQLWPPRNWDILIEETQDLSEHERQRVDSATLSSIQKAIAKALARAEMEREKRRSSPGQSMAPSEFERMAGEGFKPAVSWQHHLRILLQSRGKAATSWRIPNRKWLPHRLYAPSNVGMSYGRIGVVVDTSGSINRDQLGQFVSEINSLLNQSCEVELFLWCCDAGIHGPTVYSQYKRVPRELPLLGGGGTDFRPGFEEAGKVPGLHTLIYFTDTWGTMPIEEPRFHTIWIVPEGTGDEVPFGTRLTVPIQHHRE